MLNRKRQKLIATYLMTTLLFTGCSVSKSSGTLNSSSTDKSEIDTEEHRYEESDSINETEEDNKDTSSAIESVDIKAVDVVALTGSYSDNARNDTWTAEDSVQIELKNTTATISGDGAQVNDNVIRITQGGTYVLSGTLTDGKIFVEASKEENVHIVLNGVSITSSDYAPIVVKQAKNVYLTLEQGTNNSITDGKEYIYSDTDEVQPTAAIYSKSDLFINGTGSLTVTANYNDGITSKDDLQIISGEIDIVSEDDGILGKDSISILDVKLNMVCGGDGLKTSNEEDPEKGMIIIDGGSITITAVNDAIQAVNQLIVNDGEFDLTTNGGSANASVKESGDKNKAWGNRGEFDKTKREDGTFVKPSRPDDVTSATPSDNSENTTNAQEGPETETNELATQVPQEKLNEGNEDSSNQVRNEIPVKAPGNETENSVISTENTSSAKTLKATVAIGIFGGTFHIDSSDDAIHSNGAVRMNGGTFTISSGDDGIHADTDLLIEDGIITIDKSYEGIESQNITVNGGEIVLTSSDDGFNAAGGNDGSSVNGRPGQNSFLNGSSGVLTINGGIITVDATGDGLDANGSIYITGGQVVVNGPTGNDNGALDYDQLCEMSGGSLMIAGSNGMAQVPSSSSFQSFVATGFSSIKAGGTKVTVKDSNGEIIASLTPTKDFQMVCISTAEIVTSNSYTIEAGDESITVETNSANNLSSMGMGGGRKQF